MEACGEANAALGAMAQPRVFWFASQLELDGPAGAAAFANDFLRRHLRRCSGRTDFR
jgi:hypothetical protein